MRIAASSYALPRRVVQAAEVMQEEAPRVEEALRPLSGALRRRVCEHLGITSVRVCEEDSPYPLALEAATSAIERAGIRSSEIDLVVDFSTLPGEGGRYVSFAHKIAADIGLDTAVVLGYKIGGCAGFHLAVKTAQSLMQADQGIRNALIVAADSPPRGSRTLLPVTIQGDAGSAAVLRMEGGVGARVLGTALATVADLHDVISFVEEPVEGRMRRTILVDSARVENEVMPIYYLHFYRLVHGLLERHSIGLDAVDHFIYSNISAPDQDGFVRALGIQPEKVYRANLDRLGHTFASDLLINYTDLMEQKRIREGQTLLFASAGIGFTWGATLART
ncbi:MAG: 3-oxoacyl-[acyl-carrier-protein] synthase III C-terminal domain-containing protein [Acidobacteriota bacterium]